MNSETKPIVKDRARISKIWFVPILAVLVGLGMIFHQWQSRGVSINVSFETAEGLESGKTVVKYRNVDIGIVKSITFNNDQSKILVSISVKKSMESLLKNDTLFWVVRPRVGAGGVTGFGTLVSGAYIEISPGVEAIQRLQFVGLESPPVTPPSTPGVRLALESTGGKPLKVGNSILYRGFEVGRVETVDFDTSTRATKYDVFIDAPYDSLVTTNTYFWNVGGASLNTSPAGISVDIASIETLISGGLEFDVPEGLSLGERVDNGHKFELFDSKNSVLEGREYPFLPYLVLVEDSVGGLNEGAEVEFRGIRIGTVESVELAFNKIVDGSEDQQIRRVPVMIKIEPDRVVQNSQMTMDDFREEINNWILNGLTATIETANILTGGLKVSLDTDGDKRQSHEIIDGITVIPSTPGGFANVAEKLESILTTVDSLPLTTTVDNLNKALATADQTLLSLDQTLISLENTLKEADATLVSARPPVDLYETMRSTLVEFERTLEKVQPFIQEISNEPNALIFGDSKPQDKEPKAKE